LREKKVREREKKIHFQAKTCAKIFLSWDIWNFFLMDFSFGFAFYVFFLEVVE